MRSEAHTESAGPKVGCRETLGACRRNAPTPNLGGTKRIGRIEIVDPEPDARSHSSSQCRQTHYSDTLLARRLRGAERPVKRRPREDLGRDVVEIEMNLGDDADVLPGGAVDRDYGLDPELEVTPKQDDA